jgi:single-strand DNA-binding protein
MNDLNSIILEGNVTRKPELKETAKGVTVCNVPIAVDRSYKNSNGENTKEVSYFDIETYGKVAEFCATYADKGRGLRVVGRIKQNRWTGSDGKNASKVTIIAEHISLKPRLRKAGTPDGQPETLTALENAVAAASQVSEPVF